MAVSKQMMTRVSWLVIALASVQAAPALAQDVPAEEESTEGDTIVVTGTSIRGEAPVGSALIQVGRNEIDASPAVTATQLIREVPQVFNFGVTDSARNQSGGAGNIVYGNSINIRGLGPFATLTLLNGRRPVGQGTLGASVDPGNIPAIALERIEIIADGTSAVYGSDAVAGVANLILRRKYDGVGADVQYGSGDDYKEFTANAIIGKSWDSGSFTLAGQHSYHSALAGVDRDFYQSNLTPFGGGDYRVTQCVPGNIVFGTTFYGIPATGATTAGLVAGNRNLCDNVKATDILPRQETNSATLTFDQELSSGISLFVDALYAKRQANRRSATATSTLAVPNINPFFVSPTGATLGTCAASVGVPSTARCENVQYSFSSVYGGPATTEINSEAKQITAGLDFKISDTWGATTYVTYGTNHDHAFTVGGAVDAANLAAALRSSDPTTAFNPFGTPGGNSAAVLAGIFDNLTDTDGRTKFLDAGVKLDGALFKLPGGDVKFALGGEMNSFKLRTGQIRGRKGAQTGTDQRLNREVTSGFFELFVPIIGEENASPGFHRLSLSLAGRLDNYSDVGTTKNPKVGINWEPMEGLKFHGSYGKSFRAPLLTNLVSAGGSQLFIQNYFDPTANGGVGATVQGVAVSGGNLNLQPERARSWSFGADYTPSALPGAQISLNYFNLRYEGQITSYLSNLNVLRQEALFSSIILRGAAAQARILQLYNEGRVVNGGSVAQALAANVFVEGRPSNLGLTLTKGLDFGLSVPVNLSDKDKLKFSLRGLRFFNYNVAFTPGGVVTKQLNNIDNPLKLRMRGQIGYERGGFDFNLYANYTNGYNNVLSTLAPKVRANTTFDLNASYDFGEMLGFTKRFQIGVNAVNLFDKQPPFVDVAPTNNGGGGFDPTVASPIGRVISVSLRTKF